MSDGVKERGRTVGGGAASLVQEHGAGNALSLRLQYGSTEATRQREAARVREAAPTAGNYVGANRISRQGVPLGGEGDGTIGEHEGAASGRAAPLGAVMCDYLRAVLPAEPHTLGELGDWLGTMVERPFGWRGWYNRSASVLDGGIVAWCAEAEVAERQGVLVDLSGRACAALGARLIPFMRWCLERGKVRRVDFAIDDRRALLSYERLAEAIAAGGMVARARGYHWVLGGVSATGERTGWTLYVGSRTSEAMVRLYDKRAERIERGAGDCGAPWVRCELEASGDFGDLLAREVLERGGEVVVEQLNRRLRFAVPSESDASRERWPMAWWWREFVGSVVRGAPLKCGEVVAVTVDGLIEYLKRQAAPAMAAVCEARGGDVSWLYELVSDGARRLKPRHEVAIAAALAEAVPLSA